MWVVNIVGFVVLNFLISKKSNKCFSVSLPITTSILIIVLFGLAIVNHLDWIDYFFIAFCLLGVFIVYRDKPWHDKNLGKEILFLLLICFLIWILCQDRLVIHGDEMGVWATETKTLFYLNGFSEKGRALLGYGNYNPGLMLFMWWGCHMHPFAFSEGMMYVFYWVLFAIPIISLFGKTDKWITFIKSFLTTIILIFLVPSIVNTMNYGCLTAELPMSSFLSILLYYVLCDGDESYNSYNYISVAIMITFLKASGVAFLCAVLLLAFIIVSNKKKVYLSLLASGCIELLWLLYCAFMERTSVFSGRISDSIQDVKWYGKNVYINDFFAYVKSFFYAYVIKPINASNSGLLKVSSVIFVGIILVIIFYFAYKGNKFEKTRFKTMGWWYLGIQFLFSITLIFMCTFVFKETWCKEPDYMGYLISRYASPINLGVLLTICIYFLKRIIITFKTKRKSICLVVTSIFILLTSDLICVYKTIINPKENNNYAIEMRKDVQNKYADFFQERYGKQPSVIFVIGTQSNFSDMDGRTISFLRAPQQIIYYDYYENGFCEGISNLKEKFNTKAVYFCEK